jgi:hypothetical protein
VRQYQARDNQASAEDGEREHVGSPFPGAEEAYQPGREGQSEESAGQQRDAADDSPLSAARRALAPGDVDAGDRADQDGQVRDDSDDTPVVTGMLVPGRPVL